MLSLTSHPFEPQVRLASRASVDHDLEAAVKKMISIQVLVHQAVK